MRRFVAAYFRHPFLLVVPAIIIPIIVVFIVRSFANTYESTATIVIPNQLLTVNNGDSPYATPADNLNGRLTEALDSRTFVLQVANATDMPKTYKAGTPGVNDLMVERIVSKLVITTVGPHTLAVTYDDTNPRVAAEVISAFLTQYTATTIQQAQNSEQQTMELLQQHLAQDEDAVKTANDNLQDYLSRHPGADPNTDATLAQYETAYQTALDSYNNDLDGIQAINDQSFVLENVIPFQIADAPLVPTAPTVKSKTTLTAMVAGVGLGLGVSLGLTGLLAVLDRRIYSRDDLIEAMPVPVLEVLPQLRGMRNDQPTVESEENLIQLSKVPVLAILPRSAESLTSEDSSPTLISRGEEI